MRWPKRVTFLCIQESANWTVHRYRISRWFDAAEAELPVCIGRKLASQIHLRLLGVLTFIEADSVETRATHQLRRRQSHCLHGHAPNL